MVRTADSHVRLSVGKSSKKAAASGGSSSRTFSSPSTSDKGGGVGGNPVCPRETPSWQKPITSFFIKSNKTDENKTYSSLKNIENKENCDGNVSNVNKSKNMICEYETVELIDKNANQGESSAAASASEGSSKTSEVTETKRNGKTESSIKNNSEKQNKVRPSDTDIDKPAKKIKYEELCKNLDALEKGEMFL